MGDYGISIDGEGIAALGDQLGDIADRLEAAADRTSGIATYGFPTGNGEQALDRVLGDQELVRVALCEQLRRLRDLAHDAGGVYVSTEQLIDRRFRGIS